MMIAVDQLTEEIAQLNSKLRIREQQLKDIQEQCTHDYVVNFMHQICRRCKHAESLHY